MSRRGRIWLALVVPPFAWFGFQQGLSAVLHADCTRWGVGLVWGLAALAATGIAFRFGLRNARAAEAPADPWLARLAMVIAGIFALAIAYQTLAIAMVPPCVR